MWVHCIINGVLEIDYGANTNDSERNDDDGGGGGG